MALVGWKIIDFVGFRWMVELKNKVFYPLRNKILLHLNLQIWSFRTIHHSFGFLIDHCGPKKLKDWKFFWGIPSFRIFSFSLKIVRATTWKDKFLVADWRVVSVGVKVLNHWVSELELNLFLIILINIRMNKYKNWKKHQNTLID